MKSMKKRITACLMAVSVLALGALPAALAEEAFVIVEEVMDVGSSEPVVSVQSEPVAIVESAPQTPDASPEYVYEEPSYTYEEPTYEEPVYYEPAYYRVTFYDWYGNELGWAEVQEGGYVIAPDSSPYMEGFQFNYWFDAMTDNIEPYAFGSAVTCDISLIPYFTALPVQEAPVNDVTTYHTPEMVEIANQMVQNMVQEHHVEQILHTEPEIIERPTPEPTAPEYVVRPTPESIAQPEYVVRPTPEPRPVQEEPIEVADAEHILEAAETPEPTLEPAPVEAATAEAPVEPAPEITQEPEIAPEPEQPVEPIPAPAPEVSDNVIEGIMEAPQPEPEDNWQPAPTLAPAPEMEVPVHIEEMVMTQEQANTLIDEIMSGVDVWNPTPEPAQAPEPEQTDIPEETETEGTEDLPEEAVTEAVEEDTQPEQPVDVVMTDDMASTLIDEILSATDVDEQQPAEMLPTENGEQQAQDDSRAQLMELNPVVYVTYDYDGELVAGTRVTATAHVSEIPPQFTVHYQWQNDASGDYTDVPGATGQSYSFEMTGSEGCNWRVNVTITK